MQHQLLELLVANGVGAVLDVRAVPQSRKAGFSKTVLGASVAARGMRYVHERRLGTPKPGRDAARRGHSETMQSIFKAHMLTDAAIDGLNDAIGLAQTMPVCLLCFEREPHDCHRSIVAQMIRARTGLAIRHL